MVYAPHNTRTHYVLVCLSVPWNVLLWSIINIILLYSFRISNFKNMNHMHISAADEAWYWPKRVLSTR